MEPSFTLHLRESCSLASLIFVWMPLVPVCYLIIWSEWIFFWFLSYILTYVDYFINIINLFLPWNSLPSSTFFWLLHGNFDVRCQKSTFSSHFKSLLCMREFVCNANNAFYRLVSQILKIACERWSRNSRSNCSIPYGWASKTESTHNLRISLPKLSSPRKFGDWFSHILEWLSTEVTSHEPLNTVHSTFGFLIL